MRRQSFRSFALCYLCCLLFKTRAQKIRAQFEQEVAEQAERYAGRVSDHSLSAISAASGSKNQHRKSAFGDWIQITRVGWRARRHWLMIEEELG